MTGLERHEPQAPATLDGLPALIDALMMVEAKIADLENMGDWESLAWAKANFREFTTQLRAVTGRIDRALVDTLPDGQQDIDGLGRVQVRWSKKRTEWESDELLRDIVRRSIVDPETGEMAGDVFEAADRIHGEVSACMPVRPSTAWRTGALKERGYQLDEWCTEAPAQASVSITGGES